MIDADLKIQVLDIIFTEELFFVMARLKYKIILKDKWMILMDKYLLALYTKNMITKDILLAYARDRENIEMMIS